MNAAHLSHLSDERLAELSQCEFFDSLTLIQVRETRGRDLWFGGYSIRYRADGSERSRTPIAWFGHLSAPA